MKQIVYTSLLRADTSPLNLAPGAQADRGGSAGFGRSVHDPAQRLVHRELYRLDRRRARRGAFIGSAGEGKIFGAARADYADAAVAALRAKATRARLTSSPAMQPTR